jgi:hypothetical protein
MNIFILDLNMENSAKYLVDKHCVKMILEHCQILCSALHINPDLKQQLGINDIPYKLTHAKHPCVIWASKNYNNYCYLVAYTNAINREYKYRYAKDHKSYLLLKNCKLISSKFITLGKSLAIEELSPAKCMPLDCQTESIVDSYRCYYKNYKQHIFSWTKRRSPSWLI